jgi:CRISPR-associated protein Csm5
LKLLRFEVTLEVLTPLHIGTGEEMEPGADFVVEERASPRVAYVVDVDRALLALTAQEVAAIRNGRVAEALGERRRREFTARTVPVRGSGRVTRVRLLQRLPDGSPYIPGTTVKGSIRTALLIALAAADRRLLDAVPGDQGDARRAARTLEERAFAVQFPERRATFENRDLNRAVRASDFLPAGEAPTAFVSMSAYRLGGVAGRGQRIPIWCEAIEPGARFRGTVSIEQDSPLWDAIAPDRRTLVQGLFQTWDGAARRLIDAEAAAWARDSQPVARFLQSLRQRAGHLAVLGWGSGWRSKTVGLLLDAEKVRQVAQRYGLRRWQGRDFPHRFPVTRKLAAMPDGGLVPPGWVAVTARQQG